MGTNRQPSNRDDLDNPTNIPVPDPSSLTTAALLREIEHLRELMEGRIDSLTGTLKDGELRLAQRFDAQNKSVDIRFDATQTAMTAALQAANKENQAGAVASEKAINKSEASIEKRFDQLMEAQRSLHNSIGDTMPRREAETRIEALALKIDDLKSYANNMQGRDRGLSASWLFVIGGGGLLAAIISVAVAAITFAKG